MKHYVCVFKMSHGLVLKCIYIIQGFCLDLLQYTSISFFKKEMLIKIW